MKRNSGHTAGIGQGFIVLGAWVGFLIQAIIGLLIFAIYCVFS